MKRAMAPFITQTLSIESPASSLATALTISRTTDASDGERTSDPRCGPAAIGSSSLPPMPSPLDAPDVAFEAGTLLPPLAPPILPPFKKLLLASAAGAASMTAFSVTAFFIAAFVTVERARAGLGVREETGWLQVVGGAPSPSAAPAAAVDVTPLSACSDSAAAGGRSRALSNATQPRKLVCAQPHSQSPQRAIAGAFACGSDERKCSTEPDKSETSAGSSKNP
mmetsp:Transcript_7764/g.19992  ORF Transcript_7764/g.19992 Transcript_7764/m.19992 type:complete len:224 (-) Transcript_7764:248-919(-)